MIAKDGLRFIIPGWVLTLLLVVVSVLIHSLAVGVAAILIGLLTISVTAFFRDPERNSPQEDDLIVSPADGKVILIEDRLDEQGQRVKLVSIFLSVFNVHVNRIPVSGTVGRVSHHPGKFFKAFQREAIMENERTEIEIKSPYGLVRFQQVAGILARRIVCNLKDNEPVTVGERFGLIRFGSRVDLFLDPTIELRVKLHDRVRGGESIIGTFKTDR